MNPITTFLLKTNLGFSNEREAQDTKIKIPKISKSKSDLENDLRIFNPTSHSNETVELTFLFVYLFC